MINLNGLDLFSQMIVNPKKEHENRLTFDSSFRRARLNYKIIIQWSIWILYLHTHTENGRKRRKQRFFSLCVSLFLVQWPDYWFTLYITESARATKSESYSTQNGSLYTVQQRLILFIIIKCTAELYRFFPHFVKNWPFVGQPKLFFHGLSQIESN